MFNHLPANAPKPHLDRRLKIRPFPSVLARNLEPAASYHVAQDLAGSERLVGEQTLRHRLHERGPLASEPDGAGEPYLGGPLKRCVV